MLILLSKDNGFRIYSVLRLILLESQLDLADVDTLDCVSKASSLLPMALRDCEEEDDGWIELPCSGVIDIELESALGYTVC